MEFCPEQTLSTQLALDMGGGVTMGGDVTGSGGAIATVATEPHLSRPKLSTVSVPPPASPHALQSEVSELAVSIVALVAIEPLITAVGAITLVEAVMVVPLNVPPLKVGLENEAPVTTPPGDTVRPGEQLSVERPSLTHERMPAAPIVGQPSGGSICISSARA